MTVPDREVPKTDDRSARKQAGEGIRTYKEAREKYTIVNTRPDMAERLEVIQRLSHPTIAERELITAAQWRRHTEVFPEGQHVALNAAGLPVACSADIRKSMDFDHIEHHCLEATGDNWLTTHEPDGEWMYGCEINVHPEYRGKGLARELYNARRALIRRLNLKGHVAGGMLKGYHRHKPLMDAATYLAKVVAGELRDPVLSVQLNCGFRVAGLIQHYNDDPSSDNKAALIVWDNPDYKP